LIVAPVAAAVEHLHAKVVLQLLHGAGKRRGHPVQLFGGCGEAASAVDCIEYGHRIERQADHRTGTPDVRRDSSWKVLRK
jgi:hypothetical protein